MILRQLMPRLSKTRAAPPIEENIKTVPAGRYSGKYEPVRTWKDRTGKQPGTNGQEHYA